MNMFLADPENLNQEEEAELTYRLQSAMHEFEPGPNGKCIAETIKYCYEHKKSDYCNPCGSDSWSSLHYDDDPSDGQHDHGGGDCMCNEWKYE